MPAPVRHIPDSVPPNGQLVRTVCGFWLRGERSFARSAEDVTCPACAAIQRRLDEARV
jgi:hypothetical protein